MLCQKCILCIGGGFEELWEVGGHLDQDCGEIFSGKTLGIFAVILLLVL